MNIKELNQIMSLTEIKVNPCDAFVYLGNDHGRNLFLAKGLEDEIVDSLRKFILRDKYFANCVLKAIESVVAEDLEQLQDLPNRDVVKYLEKKEVLTRDEAAKYMGISKSYLYKLTMRQEIPHYKPMGKMCYFNREELKQWLQSNRVATKEELSDKARKYCLNKKIL